MVTTKLNLSMTEPQVRQIYAKQGDTGRVLDITLDQTPEDGTLRILRPDGVEVTSEAVTGGEVESGSTFDSLTEADVTELTVGIEPVQDLNGYDKPWVGGAGSNKWDEQWEVGLINASSGQNQDSSSYSRTKNYISIKPSVSYWFNNIPTPIYMRRYGRNKEYLGYGQFVGNGSWTSPSDTYYLRFCWDGNTYNNDIALNYPPTVTTYSPYSNICPITGHDEVTVTETGKNLCNATPTQVGTANAYIIIPNLRAGTYTFQCDYSQKFSGLYVYQGSTLSDTRVLTKYNTLSGTFTITQQSDVLINCYLSGLDATAISNIQLELGSTATSYEPYRSNTYTTSLGQTVYGGTLDMVSGVLNVTYGYKDINDFTRLSSGTSSGGLHVATLDGTYTENAPSVCSMLEQKNHAQAWGATTECYAIEGNGIRVYTTETTLANFKTKFAQLQIAYSLVEPVTYQLTSQQIKTLVGTNNVWASSGDIVSITFTYGGLLSELPSGATSIVGKCYCDIEQNGVSSMPFTLNVKKNERE